jgi:hypothetical protein
MLLLGPFLCQVNNPNHNRRYGPVARVQSNALAGPRSMQTLVAIWSELWKRKTR